MNVFLTGAAGFIGQHVARALHAAGHTVYACDILVDSVHPDEEAAYDAAEALQKAGVLAEFTGFPPSDHFSILMDKGVQIDAVIHLGALVGVGEATLRPDAYVYDNVQETVRLWQEIAELPAEKRPTRFVVASSMSIYGNRDLGDVAFEDDPITPPNVYAQTKYDQERYSILLGEAYGVPTAALRFFNVYGPGQSLSNPYTGVAAMFAAQLLHGKGGLIYEDGCQTRDFIHVSDVTRACLLALENPKAVGAFNVCTGRGVSLLYLHDILSQRLGVPLIEPRVTGVKRLGDIRHCVGAVSKARQWLGFRASVHLEEGIASYAEWLRTQDLSAINERVEQAWKEMEVAGLVTKPC